MIYLCVCALPLRLIPPHFYRCALASGSAQPSSRATACSRLSRVQNFVPPMAAEAIG